MAGSFILSIATWNLPFLHRNERRPWALYRCIEYWSVKTAVPWLEEYQLFPMLLSPVACMYPLLLELGQSQWWKWSVRCSGAIQTSQTDFVSQSAAAAGGLLCVSGHTLLRCMVKARSKDQYSTHCPPLDVIYSAVINNEYRCTFTFKCFIIWTLRDTDVSVTLHCKEY